MQTSKEKGVERKEEREMLEGEEPEEIDHSKGTGRKAKKRDQRG